MSAVWSCVACFISQYLYTICLYLIWYLIWYLICSYRVIPGSDKKDKGSSSQKQDQPMPSSSAATPPLPQVSSHASSTSASSSRKPAAAATSSYSGSRHRSNRPSNKNAPSPAVSGSSLPVRVTRSGSGYAKTPSASKVPLEPPTRITRSNTTNLPILSTTVSTTAIRPSLAVTSVQSADVVREKTKNGEDA